MTTLDMTLDLVMQPANTKKPLTAIDVREYEFLKDMKLGNINN